MCPKCSLHGEIRIWARVHYWEQDQQQMEAPTIKCNEYQENQIKTGEKRKQTKKCLSQQMCPQWNPKSRKDLKLSTVHVKTTFHGDAGLTTVIKHQTSHNWESAFQQMCQCTLNQTILIKYHLFVSNCAHTRAIYWQIQNRYQTIYSKKLRASSNSIANT